MGGLLAPVVNVGVDLDAVESLPRWLDCSNIPDRDRGQPDSASRSLASGSNMAWAAAILSVPSNQDVCWVFFVPFLLVSGLFSIMSVPHQKPFSLVHSCLIL